MRAVAKSCETGQYSVLESPTGTGKTLSLLCGSFSWLKYKQNIESANQNADQYSNINGEAMNAASNAMQETSHNHRIVYSSRTHSQLSNVVKELKKTEFRPSTSIIASRTYLCLHDRIKSLPVQQQSQMCRQMRQQKNCLYDNDSKIQMCSKHLLERTRVFDIEELVSICSSMQACPYLCSQKTVKNSEFILTPYSYIVDPISRNSLPSALFNNAILIIDEAHNFPEQCCDYSSLEISFQQFGITKSFFERTTTKMIGDVVSFGVASIDLAKSIISNMCNELEMLISTDKEINFLIHHNKANQNFSLRSASFIYNFLAKCGLNNGTISLIIQLLSICVDNPVILCVKPIEEEAMDTLKQFLELLFPSFRRNDVYIDTYYTLAITGFSDNLSNFSASDLKFSIFCFSPGKAFREIADLSPKTIILASGTLSPIKSFIDQFECAFPIILENKHIAKSEQLKIFIVSSGPNGEKLSFTFADRKKVSMQNELQSVIQEIIKDTPKGALLFFPSFTFLNEYIPLFSHNEYKKIIIEPRSSYKDFKTILKIYKKTIDDSKFFNDDPSAASDKRNEKTPTRDGCALLAVCRGKISEGIDFSDDYARSVTVVGVPFPNTQDVKVILKKEWLERRKRGLGQQWYIESAIRVVNQSIGRAIRHKDDYATVFLIDSRYEGFVNLLPKWVQPSVYKYPSEWREINQAIIPFFKEQSQRIKQQQQERMAQKAIDDNNKEKEKQIQKEEQRNEQPKQTEVIQMSESQKEFSLFTRTQRDLMIPKKLSKSKIGAILIKELPPPVQKEIFTILTKFKKNQSIEELKQNIQVLSDDKAKEVLMNIMSDKLKSQII